MHTYPLARAKRLKESASEHGALVPGTRDDARIARAQNPGLKLPPAMNQEESGQRAIFSAASDRHTSQGADERSLRTPALEGFEVLKKSGSGISLVEAQGKAGDNERVLDGVREKGLDWKVWEFAQKVFTEYAVKADSKDEP